MKSEPEKERSFHRPTGILETVVYCPDLDAAREFYEGVLGLELVSTEPGRHHFFRVGSAMLLVFNPQETSQATVRIGNQMIPRHGGSGASHFAFDLKPSQLEATRRHLRRHEIDIESEIEWPGGGHSLYCRDPAGNSVEFATRDLWFRSE